MCRPLLPRPFLHNIPTDAACVTTGTSVDRELKTNKSPPKRKEVGVSQPCGKHDNLLTYPDISDRRQYTAPITVSLQHNADTVDVAGGDWKNFSRTGWSKIDPDRSIFHAVTFTPPLFFPLPLGIDSDHDDRDVKNM